MATYTITTDNNITAYADPKDVRESGDQVVTFNNEREFGKATADWPMSRFIEIWNSLAGVVPFDDLKPVKKFTDRKSALARIWKAIQRLEPAVAPQGAPEATGKRKSKAKATDAEEAPTAPRKAKTSRNGKETASVPREFSKKAIVIELLKREGGATLQEIMAATDWQAHSVRGFISGALTKKMGLTVASTKNEAGARTYRIAG